MENVTGSASSPSIQLGDIYYLLFRHKWKIIICTLIGFIGAGLAYFLIPPPYLSEAKLNIKYVLESKNPTPIDSTNIKLATDPGRGDSVLNSEIHILKNVDLAQAVAQFIGPEKITPKAPADAQLNAATAAIYDGMFVELQPKSTVVSIVYSHPNPALVQPVLRALIEQYLKKHMEVHRPNGGMMENLLSKETDVLRARLAEIEEELRKARSKAGVISFEESKKANAEQFTRLKQDIFTAQAQLAEHQAILHQLQGNMPTEQTASNPAEAIPEQVLQNHRDLLSRIEALRVREQELLVQFTPGNARVKEVRSLLVDAIAQRRQIETSYPLITRINQSSQEGARDQIAKRQIQAADEAALVASIEAKIEILRQQLDQIRKESSALEQMEGAILDLMRQKDLEEKNYIEHSASLAKSRSADALNADHISSISEIESPTAPQRSWKKTFKIIAVLAAGGLALGLGWAVLIEFFIDRSVRRPSDVEQSLRLPLFLSIPTLDGQKHLAELPGPDVKLLRNSDPSDTSETIVPHEEANILNPYFETLRDRLIAYFDSINLRHRPKLIAVTGLGKSSGVSTTAAGLARSLSETGEGNVLLVDMTQSKTEGTTTPFSHGKAIADIDHILESRAASNTENKLFVVSEGSSTEKLSRHLPQRFSKLVPKLKASNFDYIIFDMPPVSQISVTPRLAPSMDMVLMVVESEKSDKETAQRAANLLSKANANVGVVLNKTKSYVPGILQKDKEFFLDS